MTEEFLNFQPVQGLPFSVELAGSSFCDGSYRINRPHSPCLCVEYVERGEGTVICNGVRHTARAGDLYILPPSADHYYYSSSHDPWRKIWFNAVGAIIPSLLSAYNPNALVVFHDAVGGDAYIRALHVASEEMSAASQHAAATHAFLSLLQFLYDRYGQSAKDETMRTLTNYIEAHLSEPLSVAELSALVYLSPSQINRIFRRALGVSPYAYILDRRLARAKLLLRATPMPVRDIAEGLGFCDEHYFTSLFRRKHGITPSAYRRGVEK